MLLLPWWLVPGIAFSMLVFLCFIIAGADFIGAELMAATILVAGLVMCAVVALLFYAAAGQ